MSKSQHTLYMPPFALHPSSEAPNAATGSARFLSHEMNRIIRITCRRTPLTSVPHKPPSSAFPQPNHMILPHLLPSRIPMIIAQFRVDLTRTLPTGLQQALGKNLRLSAEWAWRCLGLDGFRFQGEGRSA